MMLVVQIHHSVKHQIFMMAADSLQIWRFIMLLVIVSVALRGFLSIMAAVLAGRNEEANFAIKREMERTPKLRVTLANVVDDDILDNLSF